MVRWLTVVLRLAEAGLKSRRNLLLENLALRHQLPIGAASIWPKRINICWSHVRSQRISSVR
jgi:hypothetical protein